MYEATVNSGGVHPAVEQVVGEIVALWSELSYRTVNKRGPSSKVWDLP